jgi:hypothetical protein
MEKLENTENIGKEQAPIDENKKLVRSDINMQQNEEFGRDGEGGLEEEETMEDILNEASDMTMEEQAKLAEINKNDIENSKFVLFDYGPVIVKPDIMKMKSDVERDGNDGSIIVQDEYPVIQRHSELGDIQKTLLLSKRNSIRWRNQMKKTPKKWWKVSKKGTGFYIRYRFEPQDEA